MKAGTATAARMPMMATTIISSINVNPPWPLFVIFMAPRGATNVPLQPTESPDQHRGTSAAECHLVDKILPADYSSTDRCKSFQCRARTHVLRTKPNFASLRD